MKNCSDCGQPFEDPFRFCPEDGAPLIASEIEGSAFEESTEQLTISEVISGGAPVQSTARRNSGGLAHAGGISQVLRCPGCGSEYPRSFSSCPIDGFRLTQTIEPASTPVDSLPVVSSPAVSSEEPGGLDASASSASIAPARQTQPLEAPLSDDSSGMEAGREATPVARESHFREPSFSTLDSFGKAPRRAFSIPLAADETATERRRSYFPSALIVILIGVLSFAGLYLLLKDSGDGKPGTTALKASAVEGQENAPDENSFITTPEAARDYEEPAEEEAVENATAQEDARDSDKQSNQSSGAFAAPAPTPGGDAKRAEAPGARESQPDRSSSRPPVQQGPTPAQIAAARMNEVARQASDSRVNARLTRVRGRRTSSGYRYDLTFTLNSQSQLSLYWDKLLISTRSARGTNNSMVVPFSHNLGASGSMTFTISVEMRGADETDWQGRITCTSLGRDASGKLTRAAFATSVTPG